MTDQAVLSAEQIQAFYHDEFVEDQVRDFVSMAADGAGEGVIVDIGGGCGFFAKRLGQVSGFRTRVVDTDPRSVRQCIESGVDARIGNALSPEFCGDERVITFNLILHHLVGKSEPETRRLQKNAIRAWVSQPTKIFVNEYIYESFTSNVSGRLIYNITSSKILSAFGKIVSKVIPSLRANTFGVGVRFRSHEEWKKLFKECGFKVVDFRIGNPERVSPPLRGLFIKQIRRDSFFLERL